MIEKIKQIQNGIISIYTNKYDLNVFYAGKYIDNDKKYLMIHSVNPNGEDDGLMCIKITDIYRVDYDGEYEKNLFLKSKFSNYDITLKDNFLRDLLEYAKNKKYIVELQMYNNDENCVIGYVQEIDNEHVVINIVNESGSIEGETIVMLESISLVGCNGCQSK